GPREADENAGATQQRNGELRGQRRAPGTTPAAIGDVRKYASEAAIVEDHALSGRREWEHWNEWDRDRISRIVEDEQVMRPALSSRRSLATLAMQLGSSLLDVGCGPGALWPHFVRQRDRVWWAGSDVTTAMVTAARRSFPT